MNEIAPSQGIQLPEVITPTSMIQIAIEKGADVEQLSRLMDLQERWEAGEARKAYAQAMSDFQHECPKIEKTKKGHNSKFAGLSESLEIIKNLLKAHGFVRRWESKQDSGNLTVTCYVTHIAGHTESSEMTAPADDSGNKNNIQAIASTNTYLKRYTLFNALGLESADEDKDGNTPTTPIDDKQIETLTARIKKVGMSEERFFKAFNISAIPELPAPRFGEAMNRLNTFDTNNKAKS